MTIKILKLFNVTMVILSWLTLPFLGSRTIKRFLPATLLILIVEILQAQFGKKRGWWVFYHKPKSLLWGELPYLVGPFLTVSMWLLKWSYGNFTKFIVANGITNALFAYPFTFFAKKFRYYTLVRINHFQFFIYFFSKAFLLYGLQTLFQNYGMRARLKLLPIYIGRFFR